MQCGVQLAVVVSVSVFLQGGRGKKGAGRQVDRNARLKKTASKPVKRVSRPVRTGQTGSDESTSLTVQISLKLVGDIVRAGEGHEGGREGQERGTKRISQQNRRPPSKLPRQEVPRRRVSSLSSEDWEERELDEAIFDKV